MSEFTTRVIAFFGIDMEPPALFLTPGPNPRTASRRPYFRRRRINAARTASIAPDGRARRAARPTAAQAGIRIARIAEAVAVHVVLRGIRDGGADVAHVAEARPRRRRSARGST
jgi:hypothetical protein